MREVVRGRPNRTAVFAAGLVFAACTRRAAFDATPFVPPPSEPVASAPATDSAPFVAEQDDGPCDKPPLPLPTPTLHATCDAAHVLERISLLHVGDTHGHFHSYLSGARSPFAVLRGFVERRRVETGGRVLFVDGGDALEKGSLADVRTQGDATIHLLDRLGLDLRTIGNHDFAWGLESVARQSQAKPYPVLGSNLHGGALGLKRTVVLEIGCARIGLFGLVTNPYDETDERYDGPYLGAVTQQHDTADTDRYVNLATALVRELREEQKVDAVIAVDHLGLLRDRLLVDTVAGLDVVVSAHDHVAIPGWIQGKQGVLVSTGAWLGGRSEAKVGEATLEIDTRARTTKLLSSSTFKLEEQRDLDAPLQAEVDRVMACHAPDAEKPLADVDSPIGPWQVDAWTQILDAAIRARFGAVDAIFYEAWAYGGVVRGELARGPVTAQGLADFAFSERQKVGGPGFTAFEALAVEGAALREICATFLREPNVGQRVHRVCPSNVDDARTYRLVVERRPLHAPWLAFTTIPKGWPKPPADESAAVEAMDLFTSYARARGKACKLLDRDAPAPCR